MDEELAQVRRDLFTQITYLRKSKGLCDKLDTNKIYECVLELRLLVDELDTDDLKLFHDLEVGMGIYNLHIDREKMLVSHLLHYIEMDNRGISYDYDELIEQLPYLKDANSRLFEEGVNPKINLINILDTNGKNRQRRDSIDSKTLQDAKNELAIYSTKLDELKDKLLHNLYAIRVQKKYVGRPRGYFDLEWWKSKK